MGWTDEIDDVIGGDLTVALSYATPAGGAVATAVAPIGLRDREAGWVGFTTSLGFGKKLDRIARDPRVALTYHARTHGTSTSPRFVLVQGRAEIVSYPDQALSNKVIEGAERALGPAKHGRLFWDRWLREYYQIRVPVKVHVERIVTWPDLRCAGPPEVLGAPRPAGPPAAQAPPGNGTGPRVDSRKAARRCTLLAHHLLAHLDADGWPTVLPIAIEGAVPDGIRLSAAPGLLPPGARRAGVLAHSYRPHLVGLTTRYLTGWLEADDDRALYAPHTEAGFAAPPNKTLLLLLNGGVAKWGVRSAIKQGKLERAEGRLRPPERSSSA